MQPLFTAHPESMLPLLSMIGQAQLSIEDILGHYSRQFIEQMLLMSAQSVAGAKHPGRPAGEIRWHGSQGGTVNLGKSKLKVTRPRLRGPDGEAALPGYAQMTGGDALSRRIAGILANGVSTRKYAQVIYGCADEMGIARSAVSRHFVTASAQALAKLMARDFTDWYTNKSGAVASAGSAAVPAAAHTNRRVSGPGRKKTERWRNVTTGFTPESQTKVAESAEAHWRAHARQFSAAANLPLAEVEVNQSASCKRADWARQNCSSIDMLVIAVPQRCGKAVPALGARLGAGYGNRIPSCSPNA